MIQETHCINGHERTPENTIIFADRKEPRCRICACDSVKKWRKNNPNSAKNQELKKLYPGMTLDRYKEKLAAQNGVCAISGMPPSLDTRFKTLCVDHDHETNEIRGLLHRNINLALGLFQDNPEWLRKAADYIEYWNNQ